MRAKLYALAGLVLLSAAGAAWAYTSADQATEAPVLTEAGCCVTGDCCCPGQGACCDLTKRVTPEVAKTLTKAEGCCGTGNCCCPGAGSCCAADAGKSCCEK